MILRVLGKIAVGPRLGDGASDGGPLDALEAVELLLETVVPLARHGCAWNGHYLSTGTVSPWIFTWAPASSPLIQRAHASLSFDSRSCVRMSSRILAKPSGSAGLRSTVLIT